MRAWDYLRGEAHVFVCAAAACAVSALVLTVAGCASSVIALVCALFALATMLAAALGYARKRAFFAGLADLSQRLDKPRFASELIERPEFPEGRIAYDALAAVSKTANDEVAAYRRQAEDYRDYIETWVHEAKSPLAAAHLMVENLADGGGMSAGRLDALDEELSRIEGYIEQALFYARSEAVEKDYLIRTHELRDLVTRAVRENSRSLIGAHVAVSLKGLDRPVFADDKWVVFILGQLIQNAVKYARERGAALAFEGSIEGAGSADERVVLAVRDNGCGVSEADLPRVFEKGFTGSNGRSARSAKQSTGIGLYLVRRLCDKMGLSVAARSRAGEGFCVLIGFPSNKMHYLED